jgi:signal transduction histidine kinase
VASALQQQATPIALRWEEQARVVALWESSGEMGASHTSTASTLVVSLASALSSDGTTSEDLVVLGLTIGADAFDHGGSMHHVLRGLDLLSAMSLYAMETIVAEEAEATAVDGVRLSRRLQQAVSLLTLAATKGYLQAMSDVMYNRFRHLRHDLRNPLGTINSVLAMMDDEAVPAEARAHPRFRAMAKRNARSLGELITDRLGDASVVPRALAWQCVSLHTLAYAVRRDLRAEAIVRQASVVIDGARTRVMVDAAGLELMLHELLLDALREARPGDELHVEVSNVPDNRAAMTLSCVPARLPCQEASALERLTTLATRMGGVLETSRQEITLSMAAQRAAAVTPAPDAVATMRFATAADMPPLVSSPSSSGEAGYDLRSASQGEDGKPSPL